MSWVQNVVRQFGSYLPLNLEIREKFNLLREDQLICTYCVLVIFVKSMPSSYVQNIITAERIMQEKSFK